MSWVINFLGQRKNETTDLSSVEQKSFGKQTCGAVANLRRCCFFVCSVSLEIELPWIFFNVGEEGVVGQSETDKLGVGGA